MSKGMWKVKLYPPSGERHSPLDYINNLDSEKDQSKIRNKLGTFSKLGLGEWAGDWVHFFEDHVWEIVSGNHRLMFCYHDDSIVVVYACKKVGQKTRPRDKKRAMKNYNDYFDAVGGI